MNDPPGLDLKALRAYLGSARPLSATMFAGGRSNLTYAVTDGSSRWVLRRPPLGHVLPTAHDMVREHRVLTALTGDSFLILPHPEVAEFYQRRATDTDRWLGGMNKIQRGFDAAATS